VPTPEELRNRVRLRVEGRDVESITSADYFFDPMVRAPNGKLTGAHTSFDESHGSNHVALAMSGAIQMRCELPVLERVDAAARS
jgi:hypothetical protein